MAYVSTSGQKSQRKDAQEQHYASTRPKESASDGGAVHVTGISVDRKKRGGKAVHEHGEQKNSPAIVQRGGAIHEQW
jgi:hypothetical protein